MNENSDYRAPAGTGVGHVHLKVSDLKRSLTFYRDLLGFEVTMTYGTQAAFLSAGGYHHHIGLNTWHSSDFPVAQQKGVGLYHIAFVYPQRKDLAEILQRITDAGYPVTGAADHGVSEAIYLNDPDGNGVELYWDRPESDWPVNESGSLNMYTKQLDIENLLKTLNSDN